MFSESIATFLGDLVFGVWFPIDKCFIDGDILFFFKRLDVRGEVSKN
jgi:hypothetical protein